MNQQLIRRIEYEQLKRTMQFTVALVTVGFKHFPDGLILGIHQYEWLCVKGNDLGSGCQCVSHRYL